MTRSFDHDYIEEVIRRLGAIPVDARPAWGRMNPEQLLSHLIATIQYTTGRRGALPYRGNWITKRIIAPLVIHGIVRFPKKVSIPKLEKNATTPSGDLETLHAVLEDYLNLVQADEIKPPPHPYFGDIGLDGWARLHVHHFEHHLRQFGV